MMAERLPPDPGGPSEPVIDGNRGGELVSQSAVSETGDQVPTS